MRTGLGWTWRANAFCNAQATPSVAYIKVDDFAPFSLAGGDTRVLRVTFSPDVEGELREVTRVWTFTLPNSVVRAVGIASVNARSSSGDGLS